MKSIPQGGGNVKMKGKTTCRMNCGCCQAVNFRDKVNEQSMKDEIEEFMKTGCIELCFQQQNEKT